MAARPKGRAIGSKGSWLAEVRIDGQGTEILPCVHRHWLRGADYNDPEARPGAPVWDDFVAAIEDAGRVVLTDDRVSPPGQPGGQFGFERKGYVAIFAVKGVRVEAALGGGGGGHHLRFSLTERLVDLS